MLSSGVPSDGAIEALSVQAIDLNGGAGTSEILGLLSAHPINQAV